MLEGSAALATPPIEQAVLAGAVEVVVEGAWRTGARARLMPRTRVRNTPMTTLHQAGTGRVLRDLTTMANTRIALRCTCLGSASPSRGGVWRTCSA